jgi:hypothetical protein
MAWIRDKLSAAVLSLPFVYSISYSYSSKRGRYLISLDEGSLQLFNHLRAWWSVLTMNFVPSRYYLNLLTAHTIANNFFSVVV